MATDIRKTKYRTHKNACKYKLDAAGNPVEMRLTFEQWWQIWESSGKWEQRGHSKGQYCMCRYNDLGHYEPGNVFIDLHSRNVIAAQTGNTKGCANKGKPKPPRSAEHRAKISAANKGKKMPPRTAEHSANISAAKKGRKQPPLTDDHRAKISAAHKGKPKSAEHNAKISAALAGRKKSPEHIANQVASRATNRLRKQEAGNA